MGGARRGNWVLGGGERMECCLNPGDAPEVQDFLDIQYVSLVIDIHRQSCESKVF